MPDVICLGEVIVDLIAMDKDVGLAGTKGFYKFPGGATANVAVGVSRMGAKGGFMGVVSDDAFGDYLKNSMDAENVDVSQIRLRKGERTVVGFIAVRSDHAKDVIFYKDHDSEMFLSAEELNPEFFAASSIFHFGIICLRTEHKRRTTLRALEIAGDKGLSVSFDVNYRSHAWPSQEMAQERFHEVLDYVDILKIAEEEWPLLFGEEENPESAQKIINRGVKALVISRGENGSTIVTPDFRENVPAFSIEAIETTGAGDAFTACMLSGLAKILRSDRKIEDIEKPEWLEIIKRSNAAGAIACLKHGAMPAIPDTKALNDFLELNG